jgi:hypothetical protein
LTLHTDKEFNLIITILMTRSMERENVVEGCDDFRSLNLNVISVAVTIAQ